MLALHVYPFRRLQRKEADLNELQHARDRCKSLEAQVRILFMFFYLVCTAESNGECFCDGSIN